MKSRRQKKVPILGLLLTSLFIVLILSVVFVWVIVFKEYKDWEVNFELDKFSKDYITLTDEDVLKNLEIKLKNFSKSTQKVDFVEITDREFVFLVGESLNSSLPLNIAFEKGFVVSDKGSWDIYAKTNRKGFQLPWLVFRVIKDNTESPEIYISKMSIGNFDFTDYGAYLIIEKVNKGIRDAILLVNESDFTGRVFRNIELEKGKMIIKGER